MQDWVLRDWVRGRGMLATLLTAGVLAAGVSPSAAAQTRFSWPDTLVDYAIYASVEECLVGAESVKKQIDVRERLTSWRDTLAFDPRVDVTFDGTKLRPMPDAVVAAARRCAARFAVTDTTLAEYPLADLLSMYLMAGMDSTARALIDLRLAAIPAAMVGARMEVEDTAIMVYKKAQPFRRVAIEQILEARLRRVKSPEERLAVQFELATVAELARDSALVFARAKELAAELEKATASGKPFQSQVVRGVAAFVIKHVYYRERLDSLRRGTTPWADFYRVLRQRLGVSDPPDRATNKRLVPLEADFWYRRAAHDTVRPTPGKVGLIVSVSVRECLALKDSREAVGGEKDQCWELFAMLRRLAQRFPALDITLHVRTERALGYSAMPDSAQEAEQIRRWLHEGQKLPGTLGVSVTHFSTLPAPDGRLVAPPPLGPHTVDSDSTMVRWWEGHGRAVVVDRAGKTVEFESLSRGREKQLAEVIAAVLQQPTTLSDGAAPARAPATP